jgi:protein-S-isoprenylcysteine O-methyltransferase Ste14
MIAFERRFIPIGIFFFRHRNWAFPVLVAGFFLLAVPPSTLFGSEAVERAKDCAAVLISFAGLTLRALVIGHDYVSRAGEAKAVHASRLLTRGMFALCRNPLYTGNILIFLGIFLMHGNLWTLVLGWSSYVIIYRAIVAAEEDYLHTTFGAAYDAYCASTPRWIPNLLRLREASMGQTFNARTVLLVEYSTIGITIIALTLAEFYEEFSEPDHSVRYLVFLGGIIAAGVVWVAVVRLIKKRRWLVAA